VLFTITHRWKQPKYPSADERMDKQNVVYTSNRMLFSLVKEGNADTCSNTDEPWNILLSEISQS
jgi:hypothetical protein